MSGSFQRKSLHRKLLYSGLIVGLLTLTLVVRKADFAIGSVQVHGIVSQAKALELREEDMGEGDLTGSALMLALTGSRGLVVCYLWKDAADLQKENEWNQLELRIRLITKLQPHFMTPWLFQSWNLAYNVSVEPDSNIDKYFYITRGMQLLAQGERRNKDNPDLRYNLGFYFQDKLGMADEQNTFRSLFELSCTDPAERNPARFQLDATRPDQIEWAPFERFCTAHPFLVRRLWEQLGKTRPADIIKFLDDSRKIPSLYQERTADTPGATPLKPLDDRYPILPPRSLFEPNEPLYAGMGEIPYHLADNFVFARAWYEYAQDPLYMTPPHMPHHRPNLYRAYPARSQAYVAERLEKAGWFDLDGWQISDPRWFPIKPGSSGAGHRTVALGTDHDQPWASEAWDKAYRMYLAFGQDSAGKRYMGLNHTPAEVAAMGAMERGLYYEDRMVTNYGHWLAVTNLEREPAAVRARKKLAQAKRDLRTYGEARALQDYEDPDAFGPPSTWDPVHCTGWKKLLLDPTHADYRADEDLQEDLYKLQNEYLQVFRKVRMGRFNQAKLVLEAMARAGTPGQAGQLPQPSLELGWLDQPLTLHGPFDDVDSTGKPVFISEAARPNTPIPLEKQSPEHLEAMKKMAQQKMQEMQKRSAR